MSNPQTAIIRPGLPLLDPEFTRALIEMQQDCLALRNITVTPPLGLRYMPGVGLHLYIIEEPVEAEAEAESVGQYLGMAHLVTAQNVTGWDFVRFTSPLDEEP